MRPKGLGKMDLEVRRRTAVKLVINGGFTHRQAADAVGAVPSSVSVWVNSFRNGGEDALKAKPEPKVRARRLDEAKRERLARIIVEGAEAHGFEGGLWTLTRIKRVVEREFGESFHIGHLHRIVRDLGFSSQKPERKARQQDAQAVQTFRDESWPKMGKGRRTRGALSS